MRPGTRAGGVGDDDDDDDVLALRNCVVASFLWDSSDLACTRCGFLLFSSAFRLWIAVNIFLGRGSGSGF